jgi:hypothetical protein
LIKNHAKRDQKVHSANDRFIFERPGGEASADVQLDHHYAIQYPNY